MICKVVARDGHSGIESFQMTNGAGLVEDAWRTSGVISMHGGEGATSRCAGVKVEGHQGSSLLMDEDDAICGG